MCNKQEKLGSYVLWGAALICLIMLLSPLISIFCVLGNLSGYNKIAHTGNFKKQRKFIAHGSGDGEAANAVS